MTDSMGRALDGVRELVGEAYEKAYRETRGAGVSEREAREYAEWCADEEEHYLMNGLAEVFGEPDGPFDGDGRL